MEQLEDGLRLIEKGRQFSTLVGSIDLLALDKNNNYVVIELKKGNSPDKVVGQISRYIGWVKQNLAKEGQIVRGIIVTREVDLKLAYAVQAFPPETIIIKVFDIQMSIENHKNDTLDKKVKKTPRKMKKRRFDP